VSLHRIRERLRPLVPRRLHDETNRAGFALVGLALRGSAVHCPCCGRSYRRFVAYPVAYCPGCGSYDRQRLLCLYLDRNPELVAGDVLHFAPERSIMDRYRPRARSWLAADLDSGHALIDRTLDITQLDLPDASFDLVLCAAVLDIVEPHDEAVRELHRVARPGGTVIVQMSRYSVNRAPELYAERLREPGFDVEPVVLPEQLDESERTRLGLDIDGPLFVCRR
jgi:SAM-dependent methyltransferase